MRPDGGVEKDGHAATIGEMVFGIGREVDDFIFYDAGLIGTLSGSQLCNGACNTVGENGQAVIDATSLCARRLRDDRAASGP